MKISLFILLIIFLVSSVSSGKVNDWEISLNTGICSYDMSILKSLTEDLNITARYTMQVNTEIEHNYPAFLSYNLEAVKKLDDEYCFGFSFGLMSTGARISYKDYSGEYALDNLVNAVNLGLLVEIPLMIKENSRIKFGLESGGLLSNLTIREYLSIADNSQSIKNNFNAISIYIKGQLRFLYYISPMFDVGLCAGYLFDIGAVYHLNSRSDNYLTRQSTNVTTQWSGFRIGAIIKMKL